MSSREDPGSPTPRSDDSGGHTALVLNLRRLFEGRSFRVPDYQRGYAWAREQLADLMEDLTSLPPGKVHFTGTVVLQCVNATAREGAAGQELSFYDVVDGQQRLATLVLLLDVIRRELAVEGNTRDASLLYDTYIFGRDRNGEPIQKLTLNSDCNTFFLETLNQSGPPNSRKTRATRRVAMRSHRSIDFASGYFARCLQQIKKKRKSEFPAWLECFHKKITEQLILTVYLIQEDSEAGVIFAVMNNRGRDITALDKTKNLLLYLASRLEPPTNTALRTEINDTWTHIFTRLMSRGLGTEQHEDELLKVHWLMTNTPDDRKWEDAKSIKGWMLANGTGDDTDGVDEKIRSYVATLRSTCSAYGELLKPRHRAAYRGRVDGSDDFNIDEDLRTKVVTDADRLVRTGMAGPFVPMLIAARLRYPKAGEGYARLVHQCELYAFRVYRLAQRPANTGRRELQRLAHRIFNAKDVDELNVALNVDVYKAVQRCSDDSITSDIEHYMELGNRDWYRWRPGIWYFLYEYEIYLAESNGEKPRITWKEVRGKEFTIEHILPQNPPESGYWRKLWDEDQHVEYIDDIGNLCLTRDNRFYSNKPFPEKRGNPALSVPCYAKSDLFMERELTDYDQWTPETLRERREAIIAWANMRWGWGRSRRRR